MMDEEILLTTDTEGAPWSVVAWNVHTGTRLASFRGPVVCPASLSVLQNHTLIASEQGRSVLHVWRLARGDSAVRRQNMAASVTALAVDPSATWCAVAAAQHINVYLAASGALAGCLRRHYQPVTCVRFSDDGAALVSGGQDSLVVVWLLATCVDVTATQPTAASADAAQPLHVWTDHALPVSGLCVGGGGVRARVFTCSLDRSCRVYQLDSGRLLLSVSFECALTCVAVDPAETWLVLGGQAGRIMRVSLREPPRSVVSAHDHVGEGSGGVAKFSGHTACVTCVSVSARGDVLVSGAADASVRVWCLYTGQCRLVLPHRGTVTCVRFANAPAAAFLTDASGAVSAAKQTQVSACLAAQFQRQMTVASDVFNVSVKLTERPSVNSPDTANACVTSDDEGVSDGDEESDHQDGLKRELAHCRLVNRRMYNFMVDKISQGLLSTEEIQ